ncbi:hypothetical protein ACN27F_17965 [Solwaraspora sp. WMMB335]|uniref:hypothetical protein n=1 Tax=Solwaraspora sp. WMMB335 TaxID=3404118 RepID=UPI003B949B36
MSSTVGDNVGRLRRLRGLTQEQLAAGSDDDEIAVGLLRRALAAARGLKRDNCR